MSAAASEPDLTGRLILLVEDEFLVADTLSQMLEGLGAAILGPAATIERALAVLAGTDRVDFAVVDVNLRGERSYAVADALLERGIPFAFTTGYGASMIPERYRHAAVLQKPFGKAEMARALCVLS